MPPSLPVGVGVQNARCVERLRIEGEQRASIAVTAERDVEHPACVSSSPARCLWVQGLNVLCASAGIRRIRRRHADDDRRLAMRAVLQIERVQLVAQALRAVVVPGHHIQRLLSALMTGVLRMPHSGSLVLHMSMSLPPGRGCPSHVAQSGTVRPSGPRCFLVGVVDVHGVVHRREDDGVERALHERRVRVASRVDAQAGDVQRLRHDLPVGVERPELAESFRANGRRVQDRSPTASAPSRALS